MRHIALRHQLYFHPIFCNILICYKALKINSVEWRMFLERFLCILDCKIRAIITRITLIVSNYVIGI